MTTIQVPSYAAPAVQRLLNAIIPHIPHWHSITEIPPIDPTFPHYSRTVVLYGTYEGDRLCFSGYYCHKPGSWTWYGYDYYDDFKPTHWCDLPTPPETTHESS